VTAVWAACPGLLPRLLEEAPLAMNRVHRVHSRFRLSQVALEVEHGDVAGAVVDEAACDPAGSLNKPRGFFARGEEDVIPGGRVLSVADAEPLDAPILPRARLRAW
jgi:hypothetical protein